MPIDETFVHYGIRRDDLSTIRTLCENQQVDFEWLKEYILKPYHTKKVNNVDMSNDDIEQIIRNAINQIATT